MPPWISHITAVVGLAVSCGNLAVMVYALSRFLKRPNKTQDERLDEHDKEFEKIFLKIEHIENRLNTGSAHFKAIDEGTAVTQSALVAIMDALLPTVPDQKSKEELREKRDSLFSYLIKK